VIGKIRQTVSAYPGQFWWLFAGSLLSSLGGSIIWPFMTIYVRRTLDVPMTTVALTLTVNTLAGIAATSVAGPAIDRLGRKSAMILGLAGPGVALIGLGLARTLPAWMALMAVMGGLSPLYNVGRDAMVADLMEPERRAGAYALMRMIQNLGISVGPAVGGFITAVSYALAFNISAGSHLAFSVFILLFIVETVSLARPSGDKQAGQAEGGYGPVLRDRPFVAIVVIMMLSQMAYTIFMVLLPVYMVDNFDLVEKDFGFILAVNAAMVVAFQYPVTRVTERYPPLPVIAVGSVLYALGAGSVVLASNFTTFLVSMIVLTIGELINIPTATALVANMAPPDMRARYMGLSSLGWAAALGFGPVLGGFLNDRISPVAMWYGGLVLGLVAALGFVVVARAYPALRDIKVEPQVAVPQEQKEYI
jgi:MFS family permease